MPDVLNSKFFHLIWVLRVLFEHICYTNCFLNSDFKQDHVYTLSQMYWNCDFLRGNLDKSLLGVFNSKFFHMIWVLRIFLGLLAGSFIGWYLHRTEHLSPFAPMSRKHIKGGRGFPLVEHCCLLCRRTQWCIHQSSLKDFT